MARALIHVPATAAKGEIVELRVLISHPMETGFRPTPDGAGFVPRDIIRMLVVTYAGAEIFRAELFPAIAANPYFAFPTVATESGAIVFAWTDDQGRTETASAEIAVR